MSLLGGIGIQSLGQHNQLAAQLQMDGWNKLIRTLAHNRDIEENKAAEKRQADRQKKAQKKAEKKALTTQLATTAIVTAATAGAGALLAAPTSAATTTATTAGSKLVETGAGETIKNVATSELGKGALGKVAETAGTSAVKDGIGSAVVKGAASKVASGAGSQVASAGLSSAGKAAIVGGVGGGVGSTVGGALAQGGAGQTGTSPRGGLGAPGQPPLAGGVAQVTPPRQGTGRAGGLLSGRQPPNPGSGQQLAQSGQLGPPGQIGAASSQPSLAQSAPIGQLPNPEQLARGGGGGGGPPGTLFGLGAKLNQGLAMGSTTPPPGASLQNQAVSLPPSGSLLPPSNSVLPNGSLGRFTTKGQFDQRGAVPSPALQSPTSQPTGLPATSQPTGLSAPRQPGALPSGPLPTSQPVSPLTNPDTAQARLSGQRFLAESAAPGASPTRLDSVDQGKSALELVSGPPAGSPVVQPSIPSPPGDALRGGTPELLPGGQPPIDTSGGKIIRPGSALEALHANAEETGKPVIKPSPKGAALSEANAADKGSGFSSLSPASQGAILGGLMGLLGSLPGGQAGAQLIGQHPTINPGARLRDQEFADRQANREFNQSIAGRQIDLKESQSPSLIGKNDALADAAKSRSSRDMASAAAITNKTPALTGPQKTEASNKNVTQAVQSVRDQFPLDEATGKPTAKGKEAMMRAIRGMINPSSPNASPLQASHAQTLINNLVKEGWFNEEEKNKMFEAINLLIQNAASSAGTGSIN